MNIQANREFRDPVHGLIKLTDQEVSIIDQLAFQRLRHIKQLAMAHLVYPGALHTRFDHSLGTLHAASRILEKVAKAAQLCETDVRIVRLAALLHDIGHGPFSHVSEYLLDEYYDRDAITIATREKIHEKLTVDIINYVPSITNLLTNDEREAVCGIIRGSNRRDVRRDIVSSDLDADKIDYLTRDSHFTGVQYGSFDLAKIYDSFAFISWGGQTYLGIDESGIFATEQLILAKHHMSHQVYAHRIRVITDFMIVRGLELAIEDEMQEVIELYGYDGSPEFCENYVSYHDDRLMTILLNCASERSKSIYERLYSRRLFKQLAMVRINEEEIPNPLLRLQYSSLARETSESSINRKRLQELIANRIGCESWEVIIEVKDVKNPAYQAPNTMDPEAIMVSNRYGEPRTMEAYEELVVGQLPYSNTLYVIAPYDWKSTDIKTEKFAIEEDIKSQIDEYLGGSA